MTWLAAKAKLQRLFQRPDVAEEDVEEVRKWLAAAQEKDPQGLGLTDLVTAATEFLLPMKH